jgi:hypothetical protein
MGERKGAYRVLVGNTEENDHLEDSGVDGRIVLKWLLKWHGSMDWIDLTPNRDRWQALVNAVINPKVSQNEGNFLPS